ncbi:hypothetical protein NAT51_14885 [Flavobacterium amniphilum]|uniref:hypothetical protein n=1 Tax=Flavobacterium amniphilum TaxID=1834035 RepID=UPI002029E979|nr:hypothetical protein [Flavobacterium amniphilum]MCL9806818.1 hypothetical protein [Flavobacterium amniphilum]
MKLNIRLQILLCNSYVLLLFIAIVLTIPLQFVVFLFKGRKKAVSPLEDRLFKTLFHINDLRRILKKPSDE